MFCSCMNFTGFRVGPLNETPKLATSPQAKLVGCDAIVLCHEQWTCASCEHLPPRISLLSPLKPMLQRGLCTWTWRISDMNRAARWLTTMFLLPTRSYQPVSFAFSLLQLRLSNFSKIFGWAELDNALGIFFVLEGGFYGGKPPPPKKKQRFNLRPSWCILALLDLVGFQWCHLQRRTFPRNRAEPDDLGNLERMEWAPTFNEASLRSPFY